MGYRKWHDDIELLRITYNSPETTGHYDRIVEAKVYDHTDNRIKIITYYILKGSMTYGTEVYVGRNYVVGSNERSYSRNYRKCKGLPQKYDKLVRYLRDLWNKRWGGWQKRP